MSKLNILNKLFNGTRQLTLCPSLKVQDRAERGLYNCSLNPTGVQAKVSYAAIALEYILKGRISALETIEGVTVYGEVWNAEKTELTERFYYSNGTSVYWAGAEPTNTSHLVLPFVTFAVSENSPLSETKAAFEVCMEEFLKTGEVSIPAIYKFCDCFYYEWKTYCFTEIQTFDTLPIEPIRQACRVGNARNLFPKISSPEFKEVTLKASEEKSKEEDKFAACLNGRYILNYCWDLEHRAYIPDKSQLEGYVPNEAYFDLVDLIASELKQVQTRMSEGYYGVDAIGNNYVNAILCGKPGTGKTSLAYALGATFGMPVGTVSISENTEEDTFEGMTKVMEGGFKFKKTTFEDVFEHGGVVVIEEGNLAKPAVVMGAIGQAIVKPFILYEDGYKKVRRHPLCVVIVTLNTGTQGSRDPSESFTSRCPDVFLMDDPTEEQFIDILVKNGNEKSNCERVYNAYVKILAALTGSEYNAEDVALSVTLRHCLAALRQMRIGKPFKRAIKNTMCGAIGIKDIFLARKIYDTVVEPMRD